MSQPVSQHPVFVSSRMNELAPERVAVRKALEELRVGAWLFENDAGARPESIQTTFLEEIKEAKIYVGLFWKGYGAYTIEEYEHASKLGKDCLIYEKRSGIENRDKDLQHFLDTLNKVETGHTVRWFTSADELGEMVKVDLIRLLLSKYKETYSIWNVPHQRNLHFTGRVDTLETLHANLNKGKDTALTQALAGLGGIGKTQLALEYAYRYRKDYSVVWWIRSEEQAVLASDYAALATKLGLAPAQEQEIMIEAVKDYLQQSTGWLLVFDNVVEEKDLAPYLPPGGAGNIIITSRNTHWENISELEVSTLPRDDSARFLAQRTGRDDQEGANKVAKLLGDLPLALEQAGAYMKKTGRSFADYADLFTRKRQELWKREEAPLAYHEDATVSTTWEVSMEAVAKEAPAGIEILNLCAFLAPDNIPRSFLKKASAYLPEVMDDELLLDEGIVALRQYSLIEASEEVLSMHRLVQAVVKDKLAEAGLTWAEAAVKVVDSSWPGGTFDYLSWGVIEELMPHSYASLEEAGKVGDEDGARLMNRMGYYLQSRGQYKGAEPLLRRALEGFERVLGAEHPDTLNSVNNLAELLRSQGEYAEAEPLYRRALEGYERVLGAEHPSTLNSVNNLAALLESQGEYAEAEPLLRRALEGYERVLGHDHPNTLIIRNNLNQLLKQLRGETG